MDAELLLMTMIVAVLSGLLVLWIGRLFGSVGAVGLTMVVAGMSGTLLAAGGSHTLFEYPSLLAMSVGIGSVAGYAVFALLRKRKLRVTSIRRSVG